METLFDYNNLNTNGVLAQDKKFTIEHNIFDLPAASKNFPIVIFKGGASLEILEEVVSLFGGAKDNPTFADIRDIRIDPNAKNASIALSAEAHPPHTDGTFSKKQLTIFMLQCVVEDEKGGGNGLYWSVDDLLKDMPKHYKECLENTEVEYSRVRENGIEIDSYKGPILFKYDGEESIRWRYDSQVRPIFISSSKQQTLFDESIAWVLNWFVTEPPIEIKYKAGDIVICDNLRALHARRALKGVNRHFRRVWLELV
jgi:Taurine catabolism dioxygenase TauD, TfdA family